MIKEGLGPLPLVPEAQKDTSEENTNLDTGEATSSVPQSAAPVSSRPAILADGSYATQTSVVEANVENINEDSVQNLRSLLLSGNYFVGSVCSVALAKMALRLKCDAHLKQKDINKFFGESMLLLASILRLGIKFYITNKEAI